MKVGTAVMPEVREYFQSRSTASFESPVSQGLFRHPSIKANCPGDLFQTEISAMFLPSTKYAWNTAL
jgi:hypothetical protein